MQKQTIQDIFNSYFHGKYSFDDFSQLKLQNNIYFNLSTYNDKIQASYVKNQISNKLTEESLKLKSFHVFLNNLIFSKLKISDNVYSYRNNHTILQMLQHHKNNKYYFKTDIQNFFGSITKNDIIKSLNDNIETIPISDFKDYINHIANIVTFENKLIAGFVTSPSISNAILYNFDIKMDEYCKKNNIIYTRYSDDLIFSSQTKLTDFATIASDILQDTSENKFLLNTFKSKYLDKTKRVKILGLVITPDGHITVPKERKGNIRKLLYFYTSNQAKFKEFLFENYQGKLSKAYGELNYINDIDIDFVDFLRKKYGNYTIDKFLHGKKNDK